MKERYFRRPFDAVPIDHERSLARLRDGRVLEIPRAVAELLSQGPTDGTLEEHVDHVVRRAQLPDDRRAEAVRALSELADQGFFVTESALRARLAGTARDAPTPAVTIETIAIPTHARPDAAARCARSYLAHVKAHGRRATCVVLDSSPTPVLQSETEQRVDAVGRELGASILYANPAQKLVFAAHLARESGVAPEIVQFALSDAEGIGHDTGSNRNALLLAHAGQPFLSVDDDTVCDLVVPSASTGFGVELSSRSEPMPVKLFPDLETGAKEVRGADACVLDLHERLVGRSVGDCIGQSSVGEIDIRRLSLDRLEQLLGGGSSVLATVGGIFGDCASAWPVFHLWNPEVQEQLRVDEPTYRMLAPSRQVLRAAPAFVVSDSSFFMSTSFAVDTRSTTPPFFPTLRGQDLIFGFMCRQTSPAAMFGYLPYAVGHHPIDERAHTPERLWDAESNVSLRSVLLEALEPTQVEHASPGEARLRVMGRQLEELGALPWNDFEEILTVRIWRTMRQAIAHYESRLRAARRPWGPWEMELQRYVGTLAPPLARPHAIIPNDIRRARSPDDARALLQRMFRRFGQLVAAWPALVRASRQLRDRGITLFGSRQA
jgi:hypothetical protein